MKCKACGEIKDFYGGDGHDVELWKDQHHKDGQLVCRGRYKPHVRSQVEEIIARGRQVPPVSDEEVEAIVRSYPVGTVDRHRGQPIRALEQVRDAIDQLSEMTSGQGYLPPVGIEQERMPNGDIVVRDVDGRRALTLSITEQMLVHIDCPGGTTQDLNQVADILSTELERPSPQFIAFMQWLIRDIQLGVDPVTGQIIRMSEMEDFPTPSLGEQWPETLAPPRVVDRQDGD